MILRLASLLALLPLALACGASKGGDDVSADRATRYGMAIEVPPGWDGRITRGAIHLASLDLRADDVGWAGDAAARLGERDVLVVLFEHEFTPEEAREAHLFPELKEPIRLAAEDFGPPEPGTSTHERHGFARRWFSDSGRSFVLFAESGSRPPAPPALADLNAALRTLTIRGGDFYPGTVAPPRFARREGWHTGTSGETEIRPQGEAAQAWAATIPWADVPEALPPRRTLEGLPRDGVAIVVWVDRSSRLPPTGTGGPVPALRLSEMDRRDAWEGQVGDVPEYVLWKRLPGRYQVDVRVYFGRPDPTAVTRAEAQAMLDGLELPDWGGWELS